MIREVSHVCKTALIGQTGDSKKPVLMCNEHKLLFRL